jgi:hypothetical protein
MDWYVHQRFLSRGLPNDFFFIVSRIYDFVPPPETREPLTWQSASTVILPSFVLYYLTAYLVLTPGTLLVRLAILPISLWSFFRTATGVDLVHGLKHREGLVYINKSLVVGAFTCVTTG